MLFIYLIYIFKKNTVGTPSAQLNGNPKERKWQAEKLKWLQQYHLYMKSTTYELPQTTKVENVYIIIHAAMMDMT